MEHSHNLDNCVDVPVDEEVSRPVHFPDSVRNVVAAQPEMPADEVNPKFRAPPSADTLGLGSHITECCRKQRLIPFPGGFTELFLRPSQDVGNV